MGCRTVSANANAALAELTSWDSNWKGLRVLVAGLGLSGFSAADTLIELGAVVTVLDGRDDELNQQRGETLMIVGAHQVLLGHRQHRLALVLDVIDNGPGVPEALRERIFLPLVTGRADGTGLGLTLAQAIAQRHGGLVECDSRPGHTRFSLVLPLA